MSPPRVSVIVPVRDRRVLLLELLEALGRQTYRDFEVIVADDGSTDGSAEAAESHRPDGLRLTVVRVGGQGAVAARTAAVAVAEGDVLAFTDSDCVPRPDWLEVGLREIDAGADMVAGRTVPLRPPAPLERTVSAGSEGLYPTCNVFYRRATFDRLGGFASRASPSMGGARGGLGFGEDTLLGWAVRRAGLPWVYAPDAVVAHQVLPPDVAESFRRARLASGFPALVRQVPELRATLLRRRLLLGDRQLPFYATVAALVGRRRLGAAGALAWWAGRHLAAVAWRPEDGLTKARWVAVGMALEATTGLALLAGSVRARRVVL